MGETGCTICCNESMKSTTINKVELKRSTVFLTNCLPPADYLQSVNIMHSTNQAMDGWSLIIDQLTHYLSVHALSCMIQMSASKNVLNIKIKIKMRLNIKNNFNLSISGILQTNQVKAPPIRPWPELHDAKSAANSVLNINMHFQQHFSTLKAMLFWPDNNFQVVRVDGRQGNLLFHFSLQISCKSSLHGDVVLIRRLDCDTGVQHLLQHLALPCHRLQHLHL